jgi:predicted ArsR family transcriptional regulator
VVTYNYDHEERCRQITTLLTYSKVGSLSASAIAINLGTSDDEIRAPLESLLETGRIIQSGDGRYTGPFALAPGRTGVTRPSLDHAPQRERGEPG